MRFLGFPKNDQLIACKVQAAADKQLIAKLWAENEQLRIRLSPFTAKRSRNAKGQFMKGSVA